MTVSFERVREIRALIQKRKSEGLNKTTVVKRTGHAMSTVRKYWDMTDEELESYIGLLKAKRTETGLRRKVGSASLCTQYDRAVEVRKKTTDGLSTLEIANRMGLERHTVNNYKNMSDEKYEELKTQCELAKTYRRDDSEG